MRHGVEQLLVLDIPHNAQVPGIRGCISYQQEPEHLPNHGSPSSPTISGTSRTIEPLLRNSPFSTQHTIKRHFEIDFTKAPRILNQIKGDMRQGANDQSVLQTGPLLVQVERHVIDGRFGVERLHRHLCGHLGAVQKPGVANHEDFVFGEGFAVGEGLYFYYQLRIEERLV